MARDEVLYIFPYLISFLITSGVFLYAWRHYYVRGAATYTWFVGGQALTILGFILELISPNLQTKIQWDLFQWITDTVLVIAPFVIFATEFTETKFRRPRLTWFLLSLIPIAFLAILFTDSLHHLIYLNPHLIPGNPFTQLRYDFTFVVYLYALIYAYGYTFFGIGILLKRALQPHNLLREQFFVVALGFVISVLFSILSLFDITIGGQRDISPLTFAAGNLIVAWGLFRYGLFEIVPIARERIVENMRDPIIVLDTSNRVVDINRAALIKFDKQSSDVMGFPSTLLFEEWPIIVKQLGMAEERIVNIESKSHGKLFYYELNISPLIDSRKRLLGQILAVHDVTQHRILKDGYKQLSEQLEKRVQERTNELALAYDTTLEGWAKALELRDKETEGHSRRVTETTLMVARAMGFNEEELIDIRRGSILHDIGKMGIPDEILRKQGSLTQDEREIVNLHPQVAYNLLFKIPYLKKALEIPYCHHEKWDGTGYPRGLRENQIPLTARIFAVADVWDALSYDRPYRNAWDKDKVIGYLRDESGKHFDPKIVQIFIELLNRGEI